MGGQVCNGNFLVLTERWRKAYTWICWCKGFLHFMRCMHVSFQFELVEINAYFTEKVQNGNLLQNYILMVLMPVNDYKEDKLWHQTLWLIFYSIKNYPPRDFLTRILTPNCNIVNSYHSHSLLWMHCLHALTIITIHDKNYLNIMVHKRIANIKTHFIIIH